MDSIFIFLDKIYRIDGIFFACGERPFGRKTDDFQCIFQVLLYQLCGVLRRGTDNYLDVVLMKIVYCFPFSFFVDSIGAIKRNLYYRFGVKSSKFQRSRWLAMRPL